MPIDRGRATRTPFPDRHVWPLGDSTVNANQFADAHLEIGAGEEPKTFTAVSAPLSAGVTGGALGTIDANAFAGSTVWIIRIVVHHKNGRTREARVRLQLG